MKPINSHGFSCRWLGVGMSLLAAVASQAQIAVTYQVDMTNEPLAFTSVWVTGTAPGMGWAEHPAGFMLTNVPTTTMWSGTFTDTNPIGTIEAVKFTDDGTGWEASANRQFELGVTGDTSTPGTQVLPLAEWNTTSTWPAPTNAVTFQINLGPQINLGNFVPGSNTQTIAVSGDFEGWNAGLALSNNPDAVGSLTNIFAGTYPVVGFPGSTTINYKFRMNGGWESPISTSGNNRQANITGNPQVLPLVFYNDNSSSYDFLKASNWVTFTLYITNGTTDVTGYAFTKGVDTLWVSGDWLGWPSWGPNALPVDQQMIEVGSSDVYTNTLPVPKGNSIFITYKYSLNGVDDENGSQTNHIRLIRTFGPSYSFPTDQWSYTYQPGANTKTNIVEQSFGNLAIQPPSGGTVPITWLGRPGVVLLNGSSMSNQSSWQMNSGTDSAMSTNWPYAGGDQFFQLELLP